MKATEILIQRYPILESIKNDIDKAIDILIKSYESGGKLLVGGNGGSCSDSEHIVGELMKGFLSKRVIDEDMKDRLISIGGEIGKELSTSLQGALPAISLSGEAALSTAFMNDVDPDMTYAQQVYGYGTDKDILLAISTSGNAKNLIYAATVAKAKNMKVIALSGKDGGKLSKIADVSIIAPDDETYRIQELHLPIYHAICIALEEHFF